MCGVFFENGISVTVSDFVAYLECYSLLCVSYRRRTCTNDYYKWCLEWCFVYGQLLVWQCLANNSLVSFGQYFDSCECVSLDTLCVCDIHCVHTAMYMWYIAVPD